MAVGCTVVWFFVRNISDDDKIYGADSDNADDAPGCQPAKNGETDRDRA